MWLALITAFLAPIPFLTFLAGLLGLRRGLNKRRPALSIGSLALLAAVATGRWWMRLLRPPGDDEPRDLAPERRGTVKAKDGVTLEWEQYGSNDAPCLLFVNGWSLTHDTWYYQKKAFGDYRVIVWDLRHNGRSTAPTVPRYGMDSTVDDLAAIFDAVDAGRHPRGCVLIGHSWGAMALPLFAAAYPDRMRKVKGLVLLSGADTSLLNAMDGSGRLWRLRRPILEPFLRASCRVPHVFGAIARMLWQTGAVHAAMFLSVRHGPATRGQVDLIAHRTSHTSMRAASCVAVDAMDFDARDATARIDIPTLIIAGARDRNMPPRVQRAMAARISGSKLVVLEDCGHLTQLVGHCETNTQLRSFLDQHLPSDPEG